ncbi:hypothetical protein KV697_06705 [Sphingomonas sanguinis]|uniref:hypothetical protein n=1 Tax=Sphingomonas sanguinis TaxID=33051 RepID=UPI001C5A30AB|nr:hypothetical protein [Sphingomonas sanguinis]QXT36983.1 hypothetical protein KV697_06705 [Sphingomonas sanguinis]
MTDSSKRDDRGPSERANHRLLAISGAVGGIMGIAMSLMAIGSAPAGMKTHAIDMWTIPLPTWFAVLMALICLVVVPLISWRWHRVADEHENRAYRDGALVAFYVVSLGVPAWWFLWRGGVLPPVRVDWVYGALILSCGIVWMWRKYA